MIILDKRVDILSFEIKPGYNDKPDIVHCSSSSGYHWNTAPDKTYKFTYNLSYYAIDRETNSSFMECVSRLIMIVRIEDEQQDTLATLQAINEFDEFVKLHIQNNTSTYLFKLQFHGFGPVEHEIERMKKQIDRLKSMKPFEEKSDLEKKIDEDLDNQTMTGFKSETIKGTVANAEGTRSVAKTVTFQITTDTIKPHSKNRGNDS